MFFSYPMTDCNTVIDIDILRTGTPSEQKTMIDAVGRAFYEGVGFVQIASMHSASLYGRLYRCIAQLFDLDEDILMQRYDPDLVLKRGYGPLYCETAAGSSVPDIKRLYDIDSAMHRGEDEALLFWITDTLVPGFYETIIAYRQHVNESANTLLQMAALAAGLPLDAYTKYRRDGNLFTRLIDYPALDTLPVVLQGAVRNREHTDMAAIALVSTASAQGLEAYDESLGQWVDIPMRPDVITANAGETLQFMSRGHVRATRHRVDNDPDPSLRRQVAVNFAWFDMDAPLTPMTVGDYFSMRTRSLRGNLSR